MTFPEHREPPRHVWYDLDEALELLADLEDARDAVLDSRYLVVVSSLERQIHRLSHRLDFDDGDADGDD